MRRGVLLVVAIAGVLAFTAVAFGLTAAELEPKAQEWQAKACVSSLLTSKKAKAGQEAAVCYSLKEIDRVKQEMGKAEAETASLRQRINDLEARQTPPPESFTFFNEAHPPAGEPTSSPVLDAENYGHITFNTAVTGSVGVWETQISNDGEHWIKFAAREICNGFSPYENASATCPVTARYYRWRAQQGSGAAPLTATALAHLSQ